MDDTQNNNMTDVIEVLASIAVSLGAMNKNLSDMSKDLNTFGKAISDNTFQQTKELGSIKVRLESIAESSTAMSKAFYYNTDEGKPGSVYHIAGSLNSIKHAMPGFQPNPNSKFKQDHKVVDQSMDGKYSSQSLNPQ